MRANGFAGKLRGRTKYDGSTAALGTRRICPPACTPRQLQLLVGQQICYIHEEERNHDQIASKRL